MPRPKQGKSCHGINPWRYHWKSLRGSFHGNKNSPPRLGRPWTATLRSSLESTTCANNSQTSRIDLQSYSLQFPILGYLLNGAWTWSDRYQLARGTKHTIVTVDFFTKYVEVEPFATITKEKVTNFVWKNIICPFGIPYALITDNGK